MRSSVAGAESLETVRVFAERLGEMRVQAKAVPAGQGGRIDHQLAAHGERAARRDDHADAFTVVVLGNHAFGRRQDRIVIFDNMIGRQPAARFTDVHRTARKMQAHTDHTGRVDNGVEDPVVTMWHEVVMIERGRASR